MEEDARIRKIVERFKKEAAQHTALNGMDILTFAVVDLLNYLIMDTDGMDILSRRITVVLGMILLVPTCLRRHDAVTRIILMEMREITEASLNCFLSAQTGSFPAQKRMKRWKRLHYEASRDLYWGLWISFVASVVAMLVMMFRAIYLLARS